MCYVGDMAKNTKGRELLRAWMRKEDLGPVSAASRLGANHAQITRISAGEAGPGLLLAMRMRDVAGIPVDAWKAKA